MKGLSCAVVNFGHKVTADRMTLRAFLDSDGDADLVPVDRVRLFNRFNRVTVDLWGSFHHHGTLGTCRVGKSSNALGEPDAFFAVQAFNSGTVCHVYAK